jgi:hypothetical protein
VAREPEGLAGRLRGDVRVAVAVAADPRGEADHAGQLARPEGDAVDLLEAARHLGVNVGQRLNQHRRVVVQPHQDFVGDRRLAAADVVGLPERGDLARDGGLGGGGLRVREGQAAQALQLVGDAASFEENRPAGDFGRVRREDGRDTDAP